MESHLLLLTFDEMTVDVFKQDAGDEGLIGNAFFKGFGLDCLQGGLRDADK